MWLPANTAGETPAVPGKSTTEPQFKLLFAGRARPSPVQLLFPGRARPSPVQTFVPREERSPPGIVLSAFYGERLGLRATTATCCIGYDRWRWVCHEHFQRGTDHFSNRRDKNKLQIVTNVFGNIIDVRFVPARQQNPLDARTMCGQHFLLHAPNRKHQTR